jgi:predicted nucleic-acid-binding protein
VPGLLRRSKDGRRIAALQRQHAIKGAVLLRKAASTALVSSRSIEAAIQAWRTGRADFADYLIAALARERGARTTATFDRAAAQAAFILLGGR